MHAAALVALGLLAPVAAEEGPRGGPQGLVLVLRSRANDVDHRGLVEAVSIYTRDLGLAVAEGPDAPDDASAKSVERVAALGARLVLWCRRDPGARLVQLHVVSSSGGRPRVESASVAMTEGPELYRAIGLKLRTLLGGSVIAPAPPPTSKVEPPRAPETAPARAPTPDPASTALSARATAEAWRAPRFVITTAYRLVLPIGPGLTRHGIIAGVAASVRRSIELWAAVEGTTRPTVDLDAGTATLLDVPVHVGGRLRFGPWGRLQVAAEPALALHTLAASGVAFEDRARGHVVRFAAGVGGDVVGRLALGAHTALEAGLSVEVLLPRTRFALRRAPALDTGRTIAGASLGLSFRP